jgi:hypothetical protein
MSLRPGGQAAAERRAASIPTRPAPEPGRRPGPSGSRPERSKNGAISLLSSLPDARLTGRELTTPKCAACTPGPGFMHPLACTSNPGESAPRPAGRPPSSAGRRPPSPRPLACPDPTPAAPPSWWSWARPRGPFALWEIRCNTNSGQRRIPSGGSARRIWRAAEKTTPRPKPGRVEFRR